MRASRSKKRAVDARRTQKRGGVGRARKAGAGPLKRPAKAGGKLSRASGQGAKDARDAKDLLAAPSPRKMVAARKRAPAEVPGEGPVVRLAVGSEVGMASPVVFGAAEGRGAAAWEPSVPVPVVAERGTPPPLPAPIASFVF